MIAHPIEAGRLYLVKFGSRDFFVFAAHGCDALSFVAEQVLP